MMQDGRVPRCGIHGGIKFNKKRTIIRVCKFCGSFIMIKGSGRKPLTCGPECKDLLKQEYLDKRCPVQHAIDEKARYQGLPIERRNKRSESSSHRRQSNHEDEQKAVKRLLKEAGLI